MASGVANVVRKCDKAKESNSLDLSECQLTQFPVAVYLLLKHTEIQSCDLTCNLLKRIPAKLATKFPHLTELHLRDNKLCGLPEELRDMHNLKVLDISSNSFQSLPLVIYSFSKLQTLNAENNSIPDVDSSHLQQMTALVEVNLQDNPLSLASYQRLLQIRPCNVLLTPQDKELDAVD